MSGPFGSSQWMYSSGGFYPTEIEQSLRFNDDDSAYLSWTPASAGNQKTWTWSGWVKRGNLSYEQAILFSAAQSQTGSKATTDARFVFGSNDVISFDVAGFGNLNTPSVFRDASAWYHIVAVLDTPQATQSNRFKVYVNGVQQSLSGGLTINQNDDFAINNTLIQYIGYFYRTSWAFDGYLAEVNFIDGTALDPTDFGEFKSGVWVAKKYTGSYGTNGFYLNFSDSANIGDDLSGNANDWTANNLVATDVVLDSPTNNFNVLNAISPTNSVLSNGNLQQGGAASLYNINSTFSMTSGKWYAEFCVVSTDTAYPEFGILPNSANFFANATMYQLGRGFAISSATVYVDGSSVGTYTNIAVAGTIVGIAYDADTREVRYSVNGVWQNSGNAVATLSTTYEPDGYSFAASGYTSAVSVSNFGQDSSFAGNKPAQGNTDDNGIGDFYYAPPSGYLALCTANLPDPVIDPAQDDVPSDYFGTSLWSGNDTSQSISVGWRPDLVWLKSRNSTQPHLLYDAVRGAGANKDLSSNSSAAEGDTSGGAYGDVSSFDTNGFTVETGTLNAAYVNLSGLTYVGWSWLAGNGTSSNTDGSITSTVSVNQKAGFSVVSATAPASGAFTVGHGLGVEPSFIIVKDRNNATGWPVFVSGVTTQNEYLLLNTTAAKASLSGMFGSSLPTSTVFGQTANIGVNASSDFIAYCFAEIEGYSKFGSYVGNSSTDGPFVYTGFRPAFVIAKRTDSANSWTIQDDVRDPDNPVDRYLLADNSGAEGTSGLSFDFLSNGFKLRTASGAVNASGGTYIYMAFAENPFKYANAR